MSKKREVYLAEKRKNVSGDDQMLDKSMIHSIRKQAEGRKFKFEGSGK